MPKNNWISYCDLAWTESILTTPDDYTDETEFYVNLIRENVEGEAKNLLHLGCGAGGHDFTFKRHFKVTGIDISEGMLKIARATNPEIAYIQGDMRRIDLKETFDAVVIPDSIDYMTTPAELRKAVITAFRHLRPGGALLIVAKIREEFRDNNFCYTGAKDGIEVTIFENNHVPPRNPSTYEATFVYLIRREGELSIHTDRHRLGLFSQTEWRSILKDAGLRVKQVRLDGVYDPFIIGEGTYPMQVFIGLKPA